MDGQCLTIEYWLTKIGAEPFDACMDAILGVLNVQHQTDRYQMDILMGDDQGIETKIIHAVSMVPLVRFTGDVPGQTHTRSSALRRVPNMVRPLFFLWNFL